MAYYPPFWQAGQQAIPPTSPFAHLPNQTPIPDDSPIHLLNPINVQKLPSPISPPNEHNQNIRLVGNNNNPSRNQALSKHRTTMGGYGMPNSPLNPRESADPTQNFQGINHLDLATADDMFPSFPEDLHVITLPNGTYRGEIDAQGRLHGNGIMIFNDGSRYDGTWCFNKQNGYGEMVESDDSVYRGNFLDGFKHGFGVQESPNGEFYEGEWKMGVRDGWGTLKAHGGKTKNHFYEGQWKNDLMEGIGMSVNPLNGTWSIQLYFQGQLKAEKSVHDLRRVNHNPVWDKIAGGDLGTFRQVVEEKQIDLTNLLQPQQSQSPTHQHAHLQSQKNTQTQSHTQLQQPKTTTTTTTSNKTPQIVAPPTTQSPSTVSSLISLTDKEVMALFKQLDSLPSLPADLKDKPAVGGFIREVDYFLDKSGRVEDWREFFRCRMVIEQTTLSPSWVAKQREILHQYLQHGKNPIGSSRAKDLLYYLSTHCVDPDNALIGLVPSQRIITQLCTELAKSPQSSAPLSLSKGELVIVSLVMPPSDPLADQKVTRKNTTKAHSFAGRRNSDGMDRMISLSNSTDGSVSSRTAVLRAIAGAKETRRRRQRVAVPFAPQWVFGRSAGGLPRDGFVQVFSGDERRQVLVPCQNVFPLHPISSTNNLSSSSSSAPPPLFPWFGERLGNAALMEMLVHQPIQVLYDRLSEEAKEATRDFLEALGLDLNLLTRANENLISITDLRDLRRYQRTLTGLIEWAKRAKQKEQNVESVECQATVSGLIDIAPVKALKDFLDEIDAYAKEQIRKFSQQPDFLDANEPDDLDLFQQRLKSNANITFPGREQNSKHQAKKKEGNKIGRLMKDFVGKKDKDKDPSKLRRGTSNLKPLSPRAPHTDSEEAGEVRGEEDSDSEDQEMSEEKEREHYRKLRRYRFDPTWKKALGELQSFFFGEIVVGRIQRYHQIAETALDALQAEVQREFTSGKKKSELSQSWLKDIRLAVDQFLAKAGYRVNAVPNNYTEQPPDCLADVRYNLNLLNGILDESQDSKYGTQAMMQQVAARIYPLIDEFINNCLVILADHFRWPGTLNAAHLDILDSQRQKMATEAPPDEGEKIYPRWARDMLKDVKYLVRMKELEKDKSCRERDIVPISGLIISCFVRNQKEHQTVLELWADKC